MSAHAPESSSGRFSLTYHERRYPDMILLYSQVGELSEEQLDFLIDNLEEEWSDDRDYYLNREMVNMLQTRGADPKLIELLQRALGDKDEVDILWVDTEEEEEEF
jgi:hypothetical protein